jgi:hypothetical protein
MRASFLALKLFSITIYLIVLLALVHEMNRFVPDYILIVAILDVYLGEIFTVITFGFG